MTNTVRAVPLLGLFSVLSAAAGCVKPESAEMALPPPAVTVSSPVEGIVTDFSDFTGRLVAVESVQLRARVWGHLEKINFVEGTEVHKGDLLFVIDQRPYQAALARADAEVSESEARRDRLAKDHGRATALLQSRAISREEFEKTVGELTQGQSSVLSAIAARLSAKLNLDFTEVRSPISGQIGRAMITTGNMVSSGESGGTVLTTIVSLDPIYAYFDVDDLTAAPILKLLRESKSSGSRPHIQLGLAHEKGFPHTGELDFTDNQVDPGTGTLRMRGVFKNSGRELTPGMFVRVRVPLGQPHAALLIADRAIDSDQAQKIVFVVGANGQVEKRDVRLGQMHQGLREIIDGVKPGERVIIDGIQRVRPGATVVPKSIAMPGAPEAK